MSELGESFKFKQRRARIRELERLQELEDLQHLSMTVEQHSLLYQTFDCVRTDFEDLDGLSWECESAKQVLKDWKRQRAMSPPVPRRSRQLPVPPALKRSSSTNHSSSGFLPPVSMTRTRRPHIPFTSTDGISTTAPTNRFRVASVFLNRDDTIRTSRYGVEGDTTLPALRPLSASQSLSRLSSAKPTQFSITYVTLGRSWKTGGTKARPALPSELLPSRLSKPPTPTPMQKSAMEQYLDSDGQVLEPLSMLTSESDVDALRDGVADRGLGFGNILGDLGTQVDEPAFEQQPIDHSLELHATSGCSGQPPILTVSPRLGGSVNALWGVSGGSSRLGNSPRLASSARQWSTANPASLRTSFHRERCQSINRCRSARWKGAPIDFVAPESDQ